MEVWELIHIYNDSEGGPEEIYQGAGLGALYASETGTGDSGDTGDSESSASISVTVSPYGELEISDALWNTQSNAITNQIERLNYLKEQLGEHAGSTGIIGIVKDLGGWLLKEGMKQTLAEYIEKQLLILDMTGEIGDDIADFIAEGFIEGVAWLIDFVAKRADPGVKLCEAMIAENDDILTLEKSQQHFQFRLDILQQHQATIKELESQLIEADGKLLSLVQLAVDVIKMFLGNSESAEEEDGWETVISSLGSSIETLDEWVDNMEIADADDTEVPSAPSLPAIPEDGTKAVSRKVAYLLAHYGFKLATELLRKSRETDTHLTDLVEAVNDLKFNGVRFHASTGDVVELTGIGTVGESYDS